MNHLQDTETSERKQDGNSAPDDHRQAETYNYKPANPRRLAFLISVARGESSPADQESEALARIAAGKGGPVSLPEIQQSAGGRFIAQLCARMHSLRHRYGFNIQNRTTDDNGQKLSFYWLVLNESGGPKMSPVPMSEVKTGRPRAAAKVPQTKTPASTPAANRSGWRSPGSAFPISPKHSPGIKPPTLPAQSGLFDSGATGGARWIDPDYQRRGA